ncbi:MAG: hypothetical protein VYD49_12095 [Pseudomonadota bacterium]|nr:hypothetical protein [Pseudomonadota bacterium]
MTKSSIADGQIQISHLGKSKKCKYYFKKQSLSIKVATLNRSVTTQRRDAGGHGKARAHWLAADNGCL